MTTTRSRLSHHRSMFFRTTPLLSLLLPYTGLLLLLLLPVVFSSSSSSSFLNDNPVVKEQQCDSARVAIYENCIATHQTGPCSCAHCDGNPVDGTPHLTTRVPTSCSDVRDIYCPLIRCCTPCAVTAYHWYKDCSANSFSMHFLETMCDLDCRRYAYQDGCSLPEAPTLSPTHSPTLLLFGEQEPVVPSPTIVALTAPPVAVVVSGSERQIQGSSSSSGNGRMVVGILTMTTSLLLLLLLIG